MDIINIDNLLEYCVDDLDIAGAYYYIDGRMVGNFIITLAINNDGKIIKASTDLLSALIAWYKDRQYHPYDKLINTYKLALSYKCTETVINEPVILFVTSFATGTVHGYAGIMYILNEYLHKYQNKSQFQGYKICIYRNSQKGILDLIYHFIDKNKIVMIDCDKLYYFKQLVIIPVPGAHHSDYFDMNFFYTTPLLDNIRQTNISVTYYDRIAIIKSVQTENVTNDGHYEINDILIFCHKNKFTLVNPIQYSEVQLIKMIGNVKQLVLSWGTACFKNYVYITDTCKRIDVLCHSQYRHQFREDLVTPRKYGNADICFIMADNLSNLEIPLIE